MRLDWQRRAVILFSIFLLVLSVTLVFFAIREAEREKLLKEREIEGERRRLVESVDARARSLIREAESRVYEAVERKLPDIQSAQAAADLKSNLAGLPMVSNVFIVDRAGRIDFLGAWPLFSVPAERPKSREVSRSLEKDERWKRAEAAEFQQNDYSLAASIYQDMAAKTSDRALLALLLNREARCDVKSEKSEKALGVYRQQLQMNLPDLTSAGIPLEILAWHQIANIHLQKREMADTAETLIGFYRGLLEAKWPLTRSQYESFRNWAEHRFQTAAGALEASLRAEWDSRYQELKRQEQGRLKNTKSLEKIGERIIPRLRLEAENMRAESSQWRHISEATDSGPLLTSFLRLDDNAMLGILLDSEALAQELLAGDIGRPQTEGSPSVAIVDEAGKIIAGPAPSLQERPDKREGSQPVFTGEFADSYPPWTIQIYQEGAGAAEKQFRLKRGLYILSLAVVITALFFGGYLAIRSTARELRLAKLKSDFTATVSHEFRTPLTSIRYLAELLQRGRVRDEARKQQYYETITGESERLSRLVENLLDFSKIEAGMKEYKMEETDVSDLAADVAGRFRRQAALKDFTLETEIEGGLPVIPADKDSLSRAVFNLLDNAVKYSGGNPRVALRAWFGEGAVNIQVEDHGIGISKPEQKKIFEKFYRSESALESDVKGSGIGLPLVQHIVRAHGGEVFLESEPGKGTRVTIRFPARRTEEKKEVENG
jgi:signal transduction histidine kinase